MAERVELYAGFSHNATRGAIEEASLQEHVDSLIAIS
jgi:hypothetical protein